MAGMAGISVYILADTFFISVYAGADGLAMLNLTLPVYGVIYAIGSMIGIGSATCYAIRKAEGRDTSWYFGQSVCWTLAASIPFVLIGVFAAENVLRLMGADDTLVSIGINYMRIVFIASPLFMMNYTFTGFARNDNASMQAMVGALAGSMFNIAFDYVFMFTLGLGLTGAALATACCPIVTMCICGTHFMSGKNTVGFAVSRPSVRHLAKCCGLGTSACVGEVTSAVTTATFNTLILGIAGNTGVAAYGVIANISIVALSLFNGIAQGSQPLISESCGRGRSDEVSRYLKLGLLFSAAVEAVLITAAYGFTDSFIAVFNSAGDMQLKALAHVGMREYFLGYIFAGINVMFIAYFSATDKPGPAFVGSILRGAVAIVGCAVVMSRLFGIQGVWLSFFAAELICFVVIMIMHIADRRRSAAARQMHI